MLPSNRSITVLLAIAILAACCLNVSVGTPPQSTPQAPPGQANLQTSLEPISSEITPREMAMRILHAALIQSVWGQPAWCRVRQRIEVYEQHVSSTGSFVRGGRGSGKLNLSLQFPAGDSMNSVVQICDGQRLQTIEDMAGERRKTIVDLVKVQERLRMSHVINSESPKDPIIAMYLAIGGQAESLRKLCQQYEWHSVREHTYAGKPVWLLQGRVGSVPPAVRALAKTDVQLLAAAKSSLLPTSVRVAIGKGRAGDPLPYWLYQVEHRRADSEDSTGTNMRLITEWDSPKPITDEVDQKLFEAGTSNDYFEEETSLYLPPLPSFADKATPGTGAAGTSPTVLQASSPKPPPR
ncbi:MAG: hypothetical protein AB8B50_04550 [Pirellulaceae bacterium]